ncbi:TIR domain-containing protein [Halomonas mongoliensis]|uniref:TIR domain-containing protein n=1 Tax=Halomonas mongoliensis TaxID=321265 RepID=A0ABU1GMA3_9GAMM|nr:TIR domain-containing protein [Halomonas mongoliensis]MDR5893156.1 TIR domain-containing protein [Halomonas mongoliensis]
MPRLDEVFKKSGVPTHTFVPPSEYDRVAVALRTPGRGIIVEGPSGIGKTSCIKRAIDDVGLSDSCLFLSARKQTDADLISELPAMKNIGIVVVDDFHRLPDADKLKLTDFVKLLADEEEQESKIILIGINRAGQTLVEYAPDLLHRVETIRFGKTNVERIKSLISLGENVLNCDISISDEIAEEAEGSFAMAQVLCHEACLQGRLHETSKESTSKAINVSLPCIRESVLGDLHPRFFPISRDFATGNKLRREGRAPYLNLLRWLSQTPEGALDTREALASNPAMKGSVGQVIDKGYLLTLIRNNEQLASLFHFEPDTSLLTIEDPKLLYFIRHLIWSKFASQVGYFSIDFKSRYDFALSFAGENRDLAEAVAQALAEREMSVFYDKHEQHRILANDVEEYLAPIYRSESRFVLALLSKDYPRKIWTKFESDNFKHRFGENAVVPIWYTDTPLGMFDQSRRFGGITFDSSKDLSGQANEIADTLSQMMEDVRAKDAERADG